MAGEPLICVTGNLVADPEPRVSQAGKSWVTFRIASTPRVRDRQTGDWSDGEPLWLGCRAYGEYADNIVASLTKGMRVIVQGRLTQRSYTDNQGQQRTSLDLEVEGGALLTLVIGVAALREAALHDDAHALGERRDDVVRVLAVGAAPEPQRLAVGPVAGLTVAHARRRGDPEGHPRLACLADARLGIRHEIARDADQRFACHQMTSSIFVPSGASITMTGSPSRSGRSVNRIGHDGHVPLFSMPSVQSARLRGRSNSAVRMSESPSGDVNFPRQGLASYAPNSSWIAPSNSTRSSDAP